jgi:FkbM family methyltransferase
MSDPDKLARDERELAEKHALREYFEHARNGVVVEVGANDPSALTSQSWHFEDKLGWRSVLVEPNPELAERARQQRPAAMVFECACVANDEVGEISLYIPRTARGEIHSHAAIGKNLDDHQYAEHREVRVRSRTLNSILQECQLHHIDLLSIDVEGAELEVLKGLDLTSYRPKLILLEDKHVFLNKHRWLKSNDYILAKRTGQNCWYIPKGGRLPQASVAHKISIFRRLYFSIWLKKTKLALKRRSLKPFASL